MKRKIVMILCAALVSVSPIYASAESETPIAAQEEPETAEPETKAPETQPETQPETKSPETQPETPAPAPEPQKETEAPKETEPPETQPPQTEAPQTEKKSEMKPSPNKSGGTPEPGFPDGLEMDDSQNSSTKVPTDPKEKRQHHKIIDAGDPDEDETEETLSISIDGTIVDIERTVPLQTLIDTVKGTEGYSLDLVQNWTGLQEKEDGAQTVEQFLSKVRMAGGTMEMLIYSGDDIAKCTVSCGKTSAFIKSEYTGDACRIVYDMNDKDGEDTAEKTVKELGNAGYRLKGRPYSYFDFVPEREGYSFVGWYEGKYNGARRVNITDETDGDITLYAHWTKYGTAKVTYDYGLVPSGGKETASHTIQYAKSEDGTFTPDSVILPSFGDQTFIGWKDQDGEMVYQKASRKKDKTEDTDAVAKNSIIQIRYPAENEAEDSIKEIRFDTQDQIDKGQPLFQKKYKTDITLTAIWEQ